MKHNKKLIMLVGNIGSGKSTLAKTYTKKGYVIIARDALRYNIGGGQYIFDLNLEPAIWNTELTMVENFMKESVNIIVDEVGIERTMRARYIECACKYNYHITALVLPKLSMKESVDRRMINPHGQANRQLWEEVWIKFNSLYKPPVLAEGFNKITNFKRSK